MNIIRQRRNELMQKEDTYSLKGIAMLMIIFHHIWQVICREEYDPTPLLTGFVFAPAGCLGTGLFFLISGFGMYKSLTTQTRISIKYLFTRLKKLISPFIFCFLLFTITIILLSMDMFNIQLLIDFFTLTLPGNSTWFLKVIVVLYICLFLIFKMNVNLTFKVFLTTVLCLIYFVVAAFLLPNWWYTSILNFPLGLIIAWKYEYYVDRMGGVIITLFCLLIATRLLAYPYIIFESLLFSVIAIEMVRFININNLLLKYIGHQSLSFYLFQILFLFIGIQIGLYKRWLMFGTFVFVATFLLSYIYMTLSQKRPKPSLLTD